jgi:predicted nucleic acid-binding protein
VSVIVLDAGAVTALAHADRLRRARFDQLWQSLPDPLLVPTTVVAEVLTGRGPRDARVNRLLAGCDLVPFSELLARRAAALRHRAQRGSVVDASIVATAEVHGGGVVITSDLDDLDALAARSPIVSVVAVP